jgi:hypothetical protein
MLKPDRDGRRGNPASRKISKWMRDKLRIKDKRIAPNHSWRHTFESAHRNELEPPTREDTVNVLLEEEGERQHILSRGDEQERLLNALAGYPLAIPTRRQG